MKELLTPEGLPRLYENDLEKYSNFIISMDGNFNFVMDDLERFNPYLLDFFLVCKNKYGKNVFNRLLGTYSVLNFQAYNIGMQRLPHVENDTIIDTLKKHDQDPAYPIAFMMSLSNNNPDLTDLIVNELMISCDKKERNQSLTSISLCYGMLLRSIDSGHKA